MKVINNITKLLERRKDLRNNATKEEVLLWSHLKNSQSGFKFRRQHSIGGYIVDFYCPVKKLVIELDGIQHSTKDNVEYDKVRTNYLEGLDIRVIRFSNLQIDKNIKDVLSTISLELGRV